MSRCPLMTLAGHGPEIQWQLLLCPQSPVPCHTVPWWRLGDPQAVVFMQGILFGASPPDGSPGAVPRQGAVPRGKRVGLAGAAACAEDTRAPGALVPWRLRRRSRRRWVWGLVGRLQVPLASRPRVGLGSRRWRSLRADCAHLAPRPGRHPASPPRGSARAGSVGPVPAVNRHSQFTAHPQSWVGSLQLSFCPGSAPSPAPRQPQGPRGARGPAHWGQIISQTFLPGN